MQTFEDFRRKRDLVVADVRVGFRKEITLEYSWYMTRIKGVINASSNVGALVRGSGALDPVSRWGDWRAR